MKKNTSGTSGEGGQNPVVTPTKTPDREHELSRDCWCQPIVDGAAPDGIDLDRQIVRMRGEFEHCKELHGDGSEWAVESGSILASLIELRDLRQQLAAERRRVVEECARVAVKTAFRCQKEYNKALPGHGLPFVHVEVGNAIRALAALNAEDKP